MLFVAQITEEEREAQIKKYIDLLIVTKISVGSI